MRTMKNYTPYHGVDKDNIGQMGDCDILESISTEIKEEMSSEVLSAWNPSSIDTIK